MRKIPLVYFLATTAVASAPMASTPWRLESGPGRVHVLELFTSEGCSSCPPADAYLRTLRERADLWKAFVPLAYHVDYWNYLGWNDRFSQAAHADRQRAIAAKWGKGGVYTPAFVLDGSEVGPSGEGVEGQFSRKEPVGNLVVTRDGNEFRVRFTPTVLGGRYVARGAVLGSGLSTPVASGENARTLLRHDFVVLSAVSAPATSEGNAFVAALPALEGKPSVPGTRSLAFWLERDNDPRPVQAVGADVPAIFFTTFSKKESQ